MRLNVDFTVSTDFRLVTSISSINSVCDCTETVASQLRPKKQRDSLSSKNHNCRRCMRYDPSSARGSLITKKASLYPPAHLNADINAAPFFSPLQVRESEPIEKSIECADKSGSFSGNETRLLTKRVGINKRRKFILFTHRRA